MNHLQNLKELRKEKGLTQQAIANELSITQKTYCNYENGEREPSIEMLKRIADFFNVSIDYLLGHETKRFYTLSEDEKGALNRYTKLTEKNKGKTEQFMEQLIESQKEG